MSTISNKFYVTALEDGTTLHGQLSVDKTLTQAWSGQNAVPDWTQVANQPTLYVTLLNGSVLSAPDNTYKWFYNGSEIIFSDQPSTITIEGGLILTGFYSTSPSNLFFKTAKSISMGGRTVSTPALRVVGNIAGSQNVDTIPIRFEGSFTSGGAALNFSSELSIRISRLTANGFLGLIEFVDGKVNITNDDEEITMYAVLYNSDGGVTDPYTTMWYVNNSATGTQGQTIGGHANAFKITENDIVDSATIRCEFSRDGSTAYTAYVTIDDMQDPEYMYIQYNGNNGNAASLRKDESVKFSVWIGKTDDPTVDARWTTFKLKLLDGDAQTITAEMTDCPSADAEGLRNLSVVDGVASFSLHYDDVVNNAKRNLTGFLYASTANS